jgi:hypothetical protein
MLAVGLEGFEGCNGEYSVHCTIAKVQKLFTFYTVQYDLDLKLFFLEEFKMLILICFTGFHNTLASF